MRQVWQHKWTESTPTPFSYVFSSVSKDTYGHFSTPLALSAMMSVRKTRQPLVTKDKLWPAIPFSTWNCFALMGFLGAQASDAKQGQLIFNHSWLVPRTYGTKTGFNSNQEDGPIWSCYEGYERISRVYLWAKLGQFLTNLPLSRHF